MSPNDTFPLTQAARLVPGRGGKSPHVNTLFRWAGRGVRGVRLRTRLIGGQRMTTQQWLAEFFAAINGEAPPARTS